MAEQKLAEIAEAIRMEIKMALIQHHMTQVELSRLINENKPQVNRAIQGDMSPKSIAIRKKIYEKLDIKG